MKVLIVAELPTFYITGVIKRCIQAITEMNTTEAVLFLVSLGYLFIVFATGQSAIEDTKDGFDKTSGSKYFSKPDQQILFFRRVLSDNSPGPQNAAFASGAAVCTAGGKTGVAQ